MRGDPRNKFLTSLCRMKVTAMTVKTLYASKLGYAILFTPKSRPKTEKVHILKMSSVMNNQGLLVVHYIITGTHWCFYNHTVDTKVMSAKRYLYVVPLSFHCSQLVLHKSKTTRERS